MTGEEEDAPPPPVADWDESLIHALEEAWHSGLVCGAQVTFCPRVRVQEVDGTESVCPLEPTSEDLDEEACHCIMTRLNEAESGPEAAIFSLKGAIDVSDPAENAEVERLKASLFTEFGSTSLCGVCPVDPPVRGPYGEAEIWLRPDAVPVSQPQFRFAGERREAHARLIDEVLKAGKVEPCKGDWNTPLSR